MYDTNLLVSPGWTSTWTKFYNFLSRAQLLKSILVYAWEYSPFSKITCDSYVNMVNIKYKKKIKIESQERKIVRKRNRLGNPIVSNAYARLFDFSMIKPFNSREISLSADKNISGSGIGLRF